MGSEEGRERTHVHEALIGSSAAHYARRGGAVCAHREGGSEGHPDLLTNRVLLGSNSKPCSSSACAGQTAETSVPRSDESTKGVRVYIRCIAWTGNYLCLNIKGVEIFNYLGFDSCSLCAMFI